MIEIAGDRPPRYGEKNVPRVAEQKTPPYRRARACPSPAFRAPDPLPSVGQEHLLLTRSGAGAPELQNGHIETRRSLLPTTIARDRPSRYGEKKRLA